MAAGVVLSSLAVAVWVSVQGHDRRTVGLATASLLGLWAALGGACVLAARRKGSGRLADDFGLRLRAVDAPVGIAAGVASQLALVPLLYLPLRWLAPGFYDRVGEEADDLFDLGRGPGRALLVVLVVVGAPLVEELFYRGLVQRSVLRRTDHAVAAVGVTAVVFALAHFDPYGFLGLVAFGVVLGVLALRTGRLGPALVAHAAFNATAVALVLLG